MDGSSDGSAAPAAVVGGIANEATSPFEEGVAPFRIAVGSVGEPEMAYPDKRRDVGQGNAGLEEVRNLKPGNFITSESYGDTIVCRIRSSPKRGKGPTNSGC